MAHNFRVVSHDLWSGGTRCSAVGAGPRGCQTCVSDSGAPDSDAGTRGASLAARIRDGVRRVNESRTRVSVVVHHCRGSGACRNYTIQVQPNQSLAGTTCAKASPVRAHVGPMGADAGPVRAAVTPVLAPLGPFRPHVSPVRAAGGLMRAAAGGVCAQSPAISTTITHRPFERAK